ncbi:MAG: hypothetical protein O9289_21060 [Rhodobacteraceae bacterium]|nr:hypothetical protein [Paracoccaceae bacterium]MCZ8085671.1 hypothetical protein [Paracoccaceae bacterium]
MTIIRSAAGKADAARTRRVSSVTSESTSGSVQSIEEGNFIIHKT